MKKTEEQKQAEAAEVEASADAAEEAWVNYWGAEKEKEVAKAKWDVWMEAHAKALVAAGWEGGKVADVWAKMRDAAEAKEAKALDVYMEATLKATAARGAVLSAVKRAQELVTLYKLESMKLDALFQLHGQTGEQISG